MKVYLFILIGVLSVSQCFGFDASSVEMPASLKVGVKTLVLNGRGVREATIFKVKVYVAGLYLEAATQNPEQILNSPSLKKLEMKFVHDVKAGKLQDAWKDGIEGNCQPHCEAMSAPLGKLNAAMTDMKEGDSMSLTFFPDKVELVVKGVLQPAIEGAAFGKALLAIWLGGNPPNKSLKDGLLGKLK